MDLKSLQNKKLNLEKKVALLKILKEERNEASVQMEQAMDVFKKESKDVEQMEKSSLKSYVAMIAGRYGETLEKERQEMVEAKLKYDRAKEAFKRLDEKVKHHESLNKELENITKEYNQNIKALKEKMLKEDTHFKNLYESKRNAYDQTSKELIELVEAIDAGEIVLQELNEAKSAFDSAANWGVFDMIGGGLLATMAKHNKINEGKRILNSVSNSLKDFNRELKDVDQSKFVDMNIDLSEFLTFADYFFDGIFADFTVQSRINNVKSKIATGIREIQRINQKLVYEKKSIKEEKAKNEKALDALIVKYL
ncbi:MAG TPA: hypothetical protein VJ962_02445 [Clostridia bacterium]|nr:hypothetical protein [Clostridia bacterium]